ncbi:hypothetical protein GCM10023185_13390 [Hymenobacter saemangeumensis]|uniref:PRTRC system protein C n=1 Tax=Hymenobacter saemangeumensis TaxID=1084522 RepID=A0ABP8I7W9_9BACT
MATKKKPSPTRAASFPIPAYLTGTDLASLEQQYVFYAKVYRLPDMSKVIDHNGEEQRVFTYPAELGDCDAMPMPPRVVEKFCTLIPAIQEGRARAAAIGKQAVLL